MTPQFLLTLLFISYLNIGNCQSISDKVAEESKCAMPFELRITTYNHARMIYGIDHYRITQDSAIKYTSYLGTKQIKVDYAETISKCDSAILLLSKFDLSELNSYYSNECVMITSGNEYSIWLKANSKSKGIDLHHYYLSKVEELINLVNATIPSKFAIRYLTKDNEQNCR